jgi:hypothetical protein
VGGPAGYEDFLKAISYRNHSEHRETLEWVGGWFDPEWFDINLVRFEDPDLRFDVAFEGLDAPDTFRQEQYHIMRRA